MSLGFWLFGVSYVLLMFRIFDSVFTGWIWVWVLAASFVIWCGLC